MSNEDCAEACRNDVNCTGFEAPDLGKYCVFWLNGACDLSKDKENAGWDEFTNVLTCNSNKEFDTSINSKFGWTISSAENGHALYRNTKHSKTVPYTGWEAV